MFDLPSIVRSRRRIQRAAEADGGAAERRSGGRVVDGDLVEERIDRPA
jgi:hypothetical protein